MALAPLIQSYIRAASAEGTSARDMQIHIDNLYGQRVSASLIEDVLKNAFEQQQQLLILTEIQTPASPQTDQLGGESGLSSVYKESAEGGDEMQNPAPQKIRYSLKDYIFKPHTLKSADDLQEQELYYMSGTGHARYGGERCVEVLGESFNVHVFTTIVNGKNMAEQYIPLTKFNPKSLRTLATPDQLLSIRHKLEDGHAYRTALKFNYSTNVEKTTKKLNDVFWQGDLSLMADVLCRKYGQEQGDSSKRLADFADKALDVLANEWSLVTGESFDYAKDQISDACGRTDASEKLMGRYNRSLVRPAF